MKYFVATKPYLRSPLRYFTIRNGYGAPRIIAFANKDTAQKFKDFLVFHRNTAGEWPCVDASACTYVADINNISNTVTTLRQHSIAEIGKHINIIGWSNIEYDTLVKYNVPIITSKKFVFDENTGSLQMHIAEIGQYSVDMGLLRSSLEHLI